MGGRDQSRVKDFKCRPHLLKDTAKASSSDFSLLRRLNHPNLVRIADFGVVENSGDLFLVRDWIQGRNIYAATEWMDAEAILNVAMDISKALQYLHTRAASSMGI